ncbi:MULTISPECIES: hypothetical protein [unclassified Arthrobacter]|uniref:hypothetical protein n=1 Tax=unclassified Arthrobacter TaxID=235627 RepID=UPI0014919111|nr:MULTISPECIES: hypothetical protein [unclassified Arthrobacter]MBE0010107.1 hypothetical protein [Arthrobacter sp. AET 35A]NOJ64109.1 hypothetical protein [Arthrobacter sp. 147(2020)]
MTRRSHTYPYRATALAVSMIALTSCAADAPASEDAAPISAPTEVYEGSHTSFPADEVLGRNTFASPEDADRSDVVSTARVAALMLHSWDTTVDRTETAAAVRAIPLMSAEWAANQVEPERNGSNGEWLEPAEHGAYSVPQAVPAIGDAAQDVAPDKAIRVLDVTWRWVARDKTPLTSGGPRQVTVYLEKTEDQWDVVGHQTRDMTASITGEGK